MESIDLLEMAGIDFNKFNQKGIDVQNFAEQFLNSGLILNDNIHWIIFHGSYDLAYLLRLLTGIPLPSKEEVFQENLSLYFPNYYDIKAVIQDLNINLKGTLSRIASDLGVRRVGNTHQAGSDSLVTSKVFFQLILQYAEQIDLTSYKNKLYGFNNQSNDDYSQNQGNFNSYFVNNNMNMYGTKTQNTYKGTNINSNVYYPNNNGSNFNNFNSIWNNQQGYANNMFGGYEAVNTANVNPFFQQTNLGDMYMNNTSNMGYSMPINIKNHNSTLKDQKNTNGDSKYMTK